MKTARKILRESLPDDALFRILSRCKRSESGCLIWPGATSKKDGSGYGRIRLNNSLYCCHRVIWTLVEGEMQDKKILCHTCDNPLCCNVYHMFIGTQTDNVRDMFNKGRNRQNPKRGVESYSSKLSQKDVDYMRDNYVKYDPAYGVTPLAEKFGVSIASVSRIVNYVRYKI